MVNDHALGRIVDIDDSGVATIKTTLPNINRALDRKYDTVEIILPDGRRITPKQRRFCYMLLGAIAEHVDGIRNEETVEDAKQMMKMEFALERMERMERKLFSLSDVDETTANAFINFIIDFIIKQDIPTSFSLLENCDDIAHFVYACLVNKKCCICGKRADLHHVQSVGSQGYRDKINHIGLEALPLCREHHISLHSMGNKEFIEKWHLEPVRIDAKIAKLYNLNRVKAGSV